MARVYINDKRQEAKAKLVAEAFRRCVVADKTGQARHMLPMDLIGDFVVAILPPDQGAAQYALLAPVKGSEPQWFRSLQAAQREARVRAHAAKLPGLDVEVAWCVREYNKPTVWLHGKLVDVDQIGNEWRRSARVVTADGALHEVPVGDLRLASRADVEELNNELITIRLSKQVVKELSEGFATLMPASRGGRKGALDRARLRALARKQKQKRARR